MSDILLSDIMSKHGFADTVMDFIIYGLGKRDMVFDDGAKKLYKN